MAYEWLLESSSHGIITPQFVDKILSNDTFLEIRIQRLLDGLIFVEKGFSVHVQRMLKMSSVYTLAEILSKIFVKTRKKIGDLIYDHGLKIDTFTFRKWWLNEKWKTFKMGLFSIISILLP